MATQCHIFIVSLATSERRSYIGPALPSLGLPFEFVDGILGAALTDQEIAEVYDGERARRMWGGDLSRGEIGASLAHRAIYERIVRERIPGAIVLEDDAAVGQAFKAFVDESWKLEGMAAGVVLLYSEHGWVIRKPSFTIAGAACHRAATRLTHAVGYWISLAAAEKLLEITRKIFWTPDWPAERWAIQFHVTIPFVVGHGDFASQVDATRLGSQRTRNKSRRRPKYLSLRYYDRAVIELAKAVAPRLFIDLKKVTAGLRTGAKY